MNEIIYRIDERLVHGQVIVGWVKNLNISTLIVVTKNIKSDVGIQSIMQLAIPDEVKFIAENPEDYFKLIPTLTKKTIVLFKTFDDAYIALSKLTHKPKEIYIGGIYFSKNKMKVLDCFYISQNDIDKIHKILEMNIEIYVLPLPSSEKINVKTLLPKIKNEY